jgi:hypothetical protein
MDPQPEQNLASASVAPTLVAQPQIRRNLSPEEMRVRLEIARQTAQLFNIERYVYVSCCGIAVLLLLINAALIIRKGGIDYTGLGLLFGASAFITFSIGRLIYMWNRVVDSGKHHVLAIAGLGSPPTSWPIRMVPSNLRPFTDESAIFSRPMGAGPRNYKRPDEFIIDDLAKALAFDSEIDDEALEIECKDGRILVKGRVDSIAKKNRIETILASILGVKDAALETLVVGRAIEPPVPLMQEQNGEK